MSEVKKLGKFEIIAKIGQGAMGVVYKARDPLINRVVALKTLKAGLFEDSVLLKRFYSEARSAGNLRHPNIVTIYELGHEGDVPFIAMQFLHGESLDKVIERLPNLPLSQRIGFIVYTCRALDYAHRQNPPVIHRDIKPANVVVCPDGSVVVVDFGIARLGETSMSMSSGMLIGTLGYMSPQLFQGGTANSQSDVWATGVMLYELLAYRRPFRGENAAALMSNVVLEEPRPITEAAPGTPEDVGRILSRMLAKDVEERYQSMEEVLMDLEPVWRKLLHADIAILLENSERLLNDGDLLAAKSEIVQILNWDSTNAQAKRVSDLINAELRKQKLNPQVRLHVENAQRLLAEGHNEEARSEAQLALKLDSSYQPAAEVARQAQEALERTRKIRQALHASEEFLAEGALTDAETQLDHALALDPCNEDARNHLKQVRDERTRRELRRQRDTLLQRARTLWASLQYDECVNLLVSLDKQFPADAEVLKFLEVARQDQDDQRRQGMLVGIRELLGQGRYVDALSALESFSGQFPSDAAAKSLQAQALHGRDLQDHEKKIADGKAQLQALLEEKSFDESITLAKSLQREFPWDSELSELLVSALTGQSQVQQKLRTEQLTGEIQEMMKDGRSDEAIQTAEAALSVFPGSAEIVKLAEEARRQKAEKGKQQLLKQRMNLLEKMLAHRQLTDAVDLARQTITTLGPDSRLQAILQQAEKQLEVREQKKEQQAQTLKNAHTLLNDGRLSDAALLLKDAIESRVFDEEDPKIKVLFDEIGARRRPQTDHGSSAEKGQAAASDVTLVQPAGELTPIPEKIGSGAGRLPGTPGTGESGSDIQAKTGVKESVDLRAIVKHLAFSVGPLARFLVEKAAAKARTAEELFAEIAATIPSAAERDAFLAKKQEFLRGAAAQPEIASAVAAASGQSSSVSVARPGAEVRPEDIAKASELAARHLGPLARILAGRAAQRAKSVEDLYLILAEHLKEGHERNDFLRDAGYLRA